MGIRTNDDRVLRYSTQHVTGDPEGMIAQIRTVLEGKVQS